VQGTKANEEGASHPLNYPTTDYRLPTYQHTDRPTNPRNKRTNRTIFWVKFCI